ncbi:MAG: RNA 3'-terminal phosphate cyclase [bacterium]|nr:RNA 3'-terminal phosphate cyclase [bacterium]
MKADWITIDGGAGEGGGQILRTSLALSLVTNRPLKIERIRAGRSKPGLLRQHLTAVRAAARIGGAGVRGDEIGSGELEFVPGEREPGSQAPDNESKKLAKNKNESGERAADASGARESDDELQFAVGSAGSATLVLQTILPVLFAPRFRRSIFERFRRLRFIGGTHNAFAPPFEFLEASYLPLVMRMPGAQAVPVVKLIRPGFYPAGGGEIEFVLADRDVVKGESAAPVFDLSERGELQGLAARVISSNLARHVAERERETIQAHPAWGGADIAVENIRGGVGPGNVVLLLARYANVTEVFVEFGRQGLRAEKVAGQALAAAEGYLAGRGAAGEYLADQLLLPLALFGGGRFSTGRPSLHTITNIDVIRKFLEIEIRCEEVESDLWMIEVDR